MGYGSVIDYFMCDTGDVTEDYYVLDPAINLSDHLPVVIRCSFAVSGPTIWNTLPSTLRVSTTTLGQFQSGLKTMLLRLAYGT